MNRHWQRIAGGVALAVAIVAAWQQVGVAQNGKGSVSTESLDWQLPRPSAMLPFDKEQPIYYVSTQNPAEWQKLPSFWNERTEKATDPATGAVVERKVIKLKLPLGIAVAPKVPVENPLSVPRWALGKRLYFDTALSSNGAVACATCHDPRKGYTDQMPVSVGIGGLKGGVSAPTVLNASFNPLQFWDGRAESLEDQAQGPPQNPIEMFDGAGNAWHKLVERIRKKADYRQRFLEAFGTEPTRDTIAKAIASYERTVFSGNSIHDRAERAMRLRVEDEGSTKLEILARDYEKVLNEAFAARDSHALRALGLDPSKDRSKTPELAKSISNGRVLFFGKARCANCHVGENFTDGQFHNLGVGVRDGKVPGDAVGRFARLPTGHKNAEMVGAFRTPTLRGLVSTAPYMHDGSENTLEKVIEFYDRGGNANEFLSTKLRDLDAEKSFVASRQNKSEYKGPPVKFFSRDNMPIVPLELKLSKQDHKDVANFLRALEGDPVDPIVSDPGRWPSRVLSRN